LSDKQCLRSLIKRHYRINHVFFAEETRIEGDTLYLASDVGSEAFACCDSQILLDVGIRIVNPSEYEAYTDTILDVQPLALKGTDSRLGEGITRSLSGVVLVLCGKDESGEQVSEAGSSQGVLASTVRFDRPGSIDNGEIIIKVNCLLKSGERMKRPGPLACHKAAENISERIRTAIAALGEEEFSAGCCGEEKFCHTRRPGRPKVLLVKEVMGQGAMHEKLLLPLQPCGITGSRSNIDMGNVPLVLSPLEAIDGGVHALTCVGPSTKETSRHYFRDPLVTLSLADPDIDLCGVAFAGSPAISKQKKMVAERLGMLVEALDVQGVVVATEGYGNNHIDFAAYLEAIGKRGIPAVGVSYCGNFGPMITGNSYTCNLVDCAKSANGLENSILADNTMVAEDALLALAMLKALMRGERVSRAPRRWDPRVRTENLARMRGEEGKPFQSEIPTAVMPPVVWTPVKKPLAEMRVALVTGTGVHLKGDERFNLVCDSGFRIIPGDANTADLTVSHGGYDNSDVLSDINSMFPLDRLRELAEEGLIAGIAPRHIGFMGGSGDLKALAKETGPAIAEILKNDGVDAAIFTAG
jgi:D-proline reductase (dithiol) PrdA